MTTKLPLYHLPGGQYEQIEPLPDPPKKPESMNQNPDTSRSYLILEAFFSHRPDVLANGQGFLCEDPRNLSAYLVPDCIVAFGVDPQAITARNGFVINEVGKPPEFVLEVASKRTARRDYTIKRDIYAGFGVLEYWRFDRTGGKLHDQPIAGDRLVDGSYRPMELITTPDGMIWGHSQILGLDLCWDSGRLRFYDPATKEYLPDLAEAMSQRDAAVMTRADAEARAGAEAARANAETARANAESQRADEAQAEVRRLREKLRRESPE